MASVSYAWVQDFDVFNLVINTTTAGAQSAPDVAAIADSSPLGFAPSDVFAVWNDPANAGDVRGRILTGEGTPGTATDFQLQANAATADKDIAIAAFAPPDDTQSPTAVISYTRTQEDPGGDIYLMTVIPSGVPAVHWAAAAGEPNDGRSDVAVLADGAIAVTWTRDLAANGAQVICNVWNGPLSPRAPEAVVSPGNNGLQSEDSQIAALAGGGFVVAWEERTYEGAGVIIGPDKAYFRRYDANGVALDAAPVLVDDAGAMNRDVQLLGLNDGGFVVAYTDNQYATGLDVHAKVYDEDGTLRIDLGRVNGFFATDQSKPTLGLMSNGYFVVGWLNQGLLYIQAFDPEGNAAGLQTSQGSMIDANVAGLADGRLVNVRSSTAMDGGGDNSIRMNAFDLVRTTTGDETAETLDGDALIDVMDGAEGADSLSGFGAPDTLAGGDGADTLRGGAGDDQVDGGLDKDRLRGDADDDRLTGGDANDRLDGGAGTDTLLGGAANDELVGGSGGDVLRGGAGADLFLYGEAVESAGKARDRIADLASGDVVDLSAIDADETTGGDQAFQIVAMFTDTPGEIILRYSAGKDRTTLRGDADGDSIAELVITMDGDQTGFSGFVL